MRNLLNFKSKVTEHNLIYKYSRLNRKTIKFLHKYKEVSNLKFDFSRHICAAGQRLVNALPLGGAPSPVASRT